MATIRERNHITIIGEGEKTILFAHGFGCDQSMWRFIVPKFQKLYRVILFDYVGAGNSQINAYQSEKYSRFDGYVQDLLDIIDELQLKKIIFVGHSVSGMIGMYAAIARPEIFEQMIMIGPSPCYLNDGDDYFGGFERGDIVDLLDMMEMNFTGWASYMAPLVMDSEEHPKLTKELEGSFSSTSPTIAREFAELTFFSDHRTKLHELHTPTLIIQCSNDSVVPVEVGEYLHEQFENSTLYMMDTKGHYPHISQPAETATIILNYLEGEHYVR